MGPRTRPHPVIKKHYDRERDRRLFVTALFDESARYYDRVGAFLALGLGQYYRRWTLERAGLRRGMTVLDVATGTGQVAREAARIVHPSGVVIGVDPSRGMLEEARKSANGPLVQGIGEALPFAAERFDFVSMGFALRHVSDLEAAFAEYRRVLKPGGRVLLLEITRPRSGLGRWLARIYLQKVRRCSCGSPLGAANLPGCSGTTGTRSTNACLPRRSWMCCRRAASSGWSAGRGAGS